MKAKVKETGEIIDVYILYPTTYSRLDGNHKIIEEYDEDELEFMPGPKMVSLDKVCEWIVNNYLNYTYIDVFDNDNIKFERSNFIKDIYKKFE